MASKSFFRRRTSIYFLPVLLMLAFSCTKPQIAFDSLYTAGNTTNVLSVDTFAVQLTTVFLDSFTTSNTRVQLLGQYNDPFFGTITSRSFSEITVPATIPVLTNFSVYDSFKLIMRINRNFYGDTNNVQRINVSQLTQVMNLPTNQTAFYNNSSIPYDPLILGSADLKINPVAGVTSQRQGDSVKITMPNGMGLQLFNLLYRQSDTILNQATFRGYFKGLTVYPDISMPGAVYGFKDTMTLRIYYHEPGVVVNEAYTDFRLAAPSNNPTQFNQISYDRTGTPTQSLNALNPELPSTSSNNMAFLQPITSLYTKMLFPTISDLATYPDYLTVMRAELTIKPVQGTYSPIFSLPPGIYLAPTNQGNTIGATITQFGNGNLNLDYLYGINTSYTYDITAYIQNAVTQGAQNNAKNGLMLVTSSDIFNTIFNRAVLGNSFNSLKSNQISLKVYYASYY